MWRLVRASVSVRASGFGCATWARYLSASSSPITNIGISAHIDSGKTTLTERILYYTGRIHEIHDVRGRDGVGAKMDSMELEREKGITIQSAATFTRWNDSHINIIDTPGHVDFTIEVERSLRVLDGAVLVLCSVGGVQSQSITVDRQMKRYNVPRICFINKLDRIGASPFRVIEDVRRTLGINASAVQIPVGLEDKHRGVVDLLTGECYLFEGGNGELVRKGPRPSDLDDEFETHRRRLIERVAEVDDTIAEYFLNEEVPPVDVLKQAIRTATIANTFAPVFMGSAFKNKGVQPLLDGVVDYLPHPHEVVNEALDIANKEAVVRLDSKADKPLVALAFKLEENRFGQLTYTRVYQGTLRKGDFIQNTSKPGSKKIKVPRLVRMHSNEMEDIDEAGPGEIVAMFGLECNSGSTFTDGSLNYSMTSMYVPEPVMSYAIKTESSSDNGNFSKAISRFTREDPTFHVSYDDETKQTVIAGMGELHLQIYIERLLREYNVKTIASPPRVNYKEAITKPVKFDYFHRKQTGGAGQYARIVGVMEPIPPEENLNFDFVNELVGNNVPPEYVPAVQKGFEHAMRRGVLIGHPCVGLRVRLQDGQAHSVDSSEMAFRICAEYAYRTFFPKGSPIITEPIMMVQVEVPSEFQGAAMAGVNRRRGLIIDSVTDDTMCRIRTEVPLSLMFGYSTDLRSATTGKGEFSMEYSRHQPVPRDQQKELMDEYQKKRAAELADKK
ncbi:Elongation factor G, mitochondrial [Plasmodiophora brassicae]